MSWPSSPTSPACCPTARSCRGRRVRRRAGGARAGQCARDEAPAAHHAGYPGLLSGQRALGPVAGRPGQPAAGGLRRARPDRLSDERVDATTPRFDDSGAAKLHLVRSALRLRRDRPELFDTSAGYQPLEVSGSAAEHVVAFARGPAGHPTRVVTVVPRLVLGLQQAGGWKDTTVDLPPGEWTDVITRAPARWHQRWQRRGVERLSAQIAARLPRGATRRGRACGRLIT